jgi:hypothetical protein
MRQVRKRHHDSVCIGNTNLNKTSQGRGFYERKSGMIAWTHTKVHEWIDGLHGKDLRTTHAKVHPTSPDWIQRTRPVPTTTSLHRKALVLTNNCPVLKLWRSQILFKTKTALSCIGDRTQLPSPTFSILAFGPA